MFNMRKCEIIIKGKAQVKGVCFSHQKIVKKTSFWDVVPIVMRLNNAQFYFFK